MRRWLPELAGISTSGDGDGIRRQLGPAWTGRITLYLHPSRNLQIADQGNTRGSGFHNIKDLLTKVANDEGRLSTSISVDAIEEQVFADASLR